VIFADVTFSETSLAHAHFIIIIFTAFVEATKDEKVEFQKVKRSKKASGVSSMNAQKIIFINLQKFESRLVSWVQAHEIQHPQKKQFYQNVMDFDSS